MDSLKEWAEWLTTKRFMMTCVTIMFVSLVAGVCSCTAVSCDSLYKSESDRYKYRAQEGEHFWKSGQK